MKTKIKKILLLIMFLSLFFSQFSFAYTKNAVLYFKSDTKDLDIGDIITIELFLDSGSNNNITTVEASFRVPIDAFEILDDNVYISNNDFPMVFQNHIDTSKGEISLSISNTIPQGGDKLKIGTLGLKTKKSGTYNISYIKEKNVVLINDADNTNVLNNAENIILNVKTHHVPTPTPTPAPTTITRTVPSTIDSGPELYLFLSISMLISLGIYNKKKLNRFLKNK